MERSQSRKSSGGFRMDEIKTAAATFDAARQAMVRAFGELLDLKALTRQEIEEEIAATSSALTSLAAMKVER